MSKKSPNFIKPLVLALVLCGLGGFAYWMEYSKRPRDEKAVSDSKKVFALKDTTISRIEIHGASKKPENSKNPPLSVVLTCESLTNKLCHTEDASKWKLVEPLQTKADDTTVNSLLKNFATMTTSEIIDLSGETPEKRNQLLKDYGLDGRSRTNPETRKLSFTLEGASPITAYFGAKHPIGENVFTLLEVAGSVNENRVLVVPDWQISVFDQKTSYFRDKNLFALNEKDVTGFKLKISKKIPPGLEVKRSPDGNSWILKSGAIEAEGDVDKIDGLLSGITHLIAKDILAERRDTPEAKKIILGVKFIYDLVLMTKEGEKHIRLFESKKTPKAMPSIYALVDGSDPIFEIDSYAAEKIDLTLDELRVGKLLSVADRYSISMIEIQANGKESFTQTANKMKDGHWKVGNTETGRGKIENLLDRLTSKIVLSYSGPAPSGDRLTIRFLKDDQGKARSIAEIEFWTMKGRLYARNTTTPKKEIVELAADFNATLPWSAKTLFDEPAGSHK